ncbi:hypothetical protein ACJMK2_010751 [Sinanodonta woodiana]|uniref:Uncharacterized protein n=1 Tax=Sinanodonta woodiana TaxID=1069815 RepID=A0ABD3VGD6_SINWO
MFASRSKCGFNWVEGLQDIVYAMNTSSTRVLGCLTPFKAYYGRSHSSVRNGVVHMKIRKTISNRGVHSSLMQVSPSKYKAGRENTDSLPISKIKDANKKIYRQEKN